MAPSKTDANHAVPSESNSTSQKTETLIKVITLLKRKNGMSREEFKEFYETHHSKLFEKFLALPGIVRYVRRYVAPIPDGITGEVLDSKYDVVMEVWLNDRELYQNWTSGAMMGPEYRAFIAEEEALLFDRGQISVMVVEEECDSVLPGKAAKKWDVVS